MTATIPTTARAILRKVAPEVDVDAIARRVAFARLLPRWRDNTPKRDRADLLTVVDRVAGYAAAADRLADGGARQSGPVGPIRVRVDTEQDRAELLAALRTLASAQQVTVIVEVDE